MKNLDPFFEKTGRKSVDSIIDNRTQKLKDVIKKFLPKTQIAKFAVGYFFISGFECFKNEFSELDELFILMGNTTDSETVEQIAAGYHRLELVQKKANIKRINASKKIEKINSVVHNLNESISYMDQTDDSEDYIHLLSKMIKENKLHIRVFTKSILHAKAYIFTLRDQEIHKGYALVGSSNLSLSGVAHNTELNLFVPIKEIYEGLNEWFNELWNEATEFDENLINILNRSWALNQVSPYDLYIKTLYELISARSEIGEDYLLYYDKKFPELLEFQEVAFKQAIKIIEKHNGVFIADVVGLGKTFIGTALLKYYQMKYHTSALIVCPPSLSDMWEYFKNRYGLSATILTTGELSQTVTIEDSKGRNGVERIPKWNGLEINPQYQYHDLVLIDESHNFRNSGNIRYSVLSPFTQDRKVLLLTATPQNNSPWDLYNQIRLFHPNDDTKIPIEGSNLREYFRKLTREDYEDLTENEKKERSLKLQKLLRHILIRRPRSHIEKYYAEDDDKGNKYILLKKGGSLQKVYFPKRELQTWTYSIDTTYSGVYESIYETIGYKAEETCKDEENLKGLSYAFYSLGNYLKPEAIENTDEKKKQIYSKLGTAGRNLKGLMRILLFKRFESSVYAFRESIRKMILFQKIYLEGLEKNKIFVGKESQNFMARMFTELRTMDLNSDDINLEIEDKVNEYSQSILDLNDFNITDLKIDIKNDIEKLEGIFEKVKNITPQKDRKLQTLKKQLDKSEFKNTNRKILIFTQFIDTAKYIDENLDIFEKTVQIQMDSSTKDKKYKIARFAPESNPEIIQEMKALKKEFSPYHVVISTDILSEGLNLQDCFTIINYDLHWNPVRLIQRMGRVDRIGTTAPAIYVYNFLPEVEIEAKLGIKKQLEERIQEIHDVIGEDSQILDFTERINKEAFYAIYSDDKEKQQEIIDNSKDDELLFGLNEAEELIRKLKRENKEYIDYIKKLPKGIRSGKINIGQLKNFFFVSFEAGAFIKYYLVDGNNKIVSDDLIQCLNAIKCEREELSIQIPKNHNRVIQTIYENFKNEVKKQKSEWEVKSKIKKEQRDLSDRLRSTPIDDDILRKKINSLNLLLEKPIPDRIIKQLKNVKDQELLIEELVQKLSEIYTQNRIPEIQSRLQSLTDLIDTPRIITSMFLKKSDKQV